MGHAYCKFVKVKRKSTVISSNKRGRNSFIRGRCVFEAILYMNKDKS